MILCHWQVWMLKMAFPSFYIVDFKIFWGKEGMPQDLIGWGACRPLTCYIHLPFPWHMPTSRHFETPAQAPAPCERSIFHLHCNSFHSASEKLLFQIKTPSLLFYKICISLACFIGIVNSVFEVCRSVNILSLGEQTSGTWLFIVMTGFWQQ